MATITLARVKRTATAAAANPTGMSLAKVGTCACADLIKGRKRRKKLRGSPADYLKWLEKETPSLAEAIKSAFDALKAEALKYLQAQLRAAKTQRVALDLFKAGPSLDWTVLYGVLEQNLTDAFKVNAQRGLAQIGVALTDDLTEQLDERASSWAQTRSAQLVGMRRTKSGALVPTPRAEYAVSDTTRAGIQQILTNAVDEGWSTEDLASELEEAYEFSAARAETIARTELAQSHTNGNYAGWQESGVVTQKQSILGSEHDLDDVCNGNAEAGPVGLDEEFPSGDLLPPYHPNCVCDVIPILSEDNTS